MASPNPNNYPQIINPNYDPTLPPSSSSSSRPSMYPSINPNDLNEPLFPQNYSNPPNSISAPPYEPYSPSAPPNLPYPPSAPPNLPYSPSAPPSPPHDDALLVIPGAILHLIDKEYSVELATGDLVIHHLVQGDNTVAVLASVADEVQWPLTKDITSVKLDDSHYFFSFTAPIETKSKSKKSKKKKGKEDEKLKDDVLSYGLTIASKGQESLVRELEGVLESYSSFSVRKVEEEAKSEVLDGAVAVGRDLSPAELERDKKKKEVAEERCGAYWTTLAPNVEEYSGTAAKFIASGSGKMIQGILWCGDVTSDRLKWGDEVLRKRMSPGEKAEISPDTLKRIKRVKRVSKMTQSVASVLLSGAVKVSGYFASSFVNSKMGKKFFGALPGEVLLASLDGFSKICDAAEVAGKNVMSTSSTVTTGLVHHKYGEEAAKATSEGLDAAGHAVGTAWTVLKLRQALNPKSVLKPSTFAKAAATAEKKAAAEKKAKDSK